MRLMGNALFCLTKNGYQWCVLAHEFPPFSLVYYYFRCWQAGGHWAALNQAQVRRQRQMADPSWQPSLSVARLDAQSIKCSKRGVADKDFDNHKRSRPASASWLSILTDFCWQPT